MARIAVQLPPGLKSDDTSYSIQGHYRLADHVRFTKERAEVAKGFERVYLDPIAGICRNILAWKDNINIPMIALGTNSRLIVWRGGAIFDITPAEYAAAATAAVTAPGFGMGDYGAGPYGLYDDDVASYGIKTWNLQNYDQGLVVAPRMGPIYVWENDYDAVATKLSDTPDPNNPGETIAKHVPEVVNSLVYTKEGQLMALGCSEEYAADGTVGGVYNPLLIRGSEVGGEIWTWNVSNGLVDVLGPATNAFSKELASGGSIVAGRVWGDVVGVWTQSNVWTCRFVGGDLKVQVDPVVGSVGLLGPNAVTVFGNTAFWISPDIQLWTCSLGGQPQMVECPIIEDTLRRMVVSQSDKVLVSFIGSANEIRIDYPDERDGDEQENSRYITVHLASGAWSRGVESRTAFEQAPSFQYPIAARGYKKVLPHLGTIDTLAEGVTALEQYLKAENVFPNVAEKAKMDFDGQASDLPNSTGEMAWSIRMVGDGVNDSVARLVEPDIFQTDVVTVSYRARVINATFANLRCRVYHTPSIEYDISNNLVGLNGGLQTFTHTFTMPNNTTVPVVEFSCKDSLNEMLPDGVQLEITDFKVERSDAKTAWVPSLNEPDLHTAYNQFLTTRVYEQDMSDFYYQEFGENADGGPLTWMIETNDFAFDEAVSSFLVTGFIPDFIDQKGIVYVTFFFRDSPQDTAEYASGPHAILPGQDRVDFMETGKLVRMRLEGSSTPCSLRFGRPLFDAVPAGRR